MSRLKKCNVCKAKPVWRVGATACGPECAETSGRLATEKAARIEVKKKAAELKAALLEYKPLSYFEAKAQFHCNAYIRARDPDMCISCGVRHSSPWQAGHYIGVGANSTLRYNELNINKQCVRCNMHKGSNAIEYRKGMLEKYGAEIVDALEGWHSPIKSTREYCELVAQYYIGKLKELKAARKHNYQQ
jgi:hypothetical protein